MTAFPAPYRRLRSDARALARCHQRLITGRTAGDHLTELGAALGITQNQLTREDVTGDGPKWRAARAARIARLRDALDVLGFDFDDTFEEA